MACQMRKSARAGKWLNKQLISLQMSRDKKYIKLSTVYHLYLIVNEREKKVNKERKRETKREREGEREDDFSYL